MGYHRLGGGWLRRKGKIPASVKVVSVISLAIRTRVSAAVSARYTRYATAPGTASHESLTVPSLITTVRSIRLSAAEGPGASSGHAVRSIVKAMTAPIAVITPNRGAFFLVFLGLYIIVYLLCR